ncbi:class I SAM-dependent methyltransferase [Priestia taiwanensis]|uniref:Methyltransferase domain-containing protein n=1 Tax=Priestia taiwanensis TaxID=1347902 RepID=A0A917AXT0_9BACI|nr:methyltransferase domain-containing protein [Priestia taiwanensis]MBM7364387.1 ubiquinone/menaquinone biosynthesis C-methylase UbiE [Priestia taiwanensis]GGE81774.1 hypothetical protein GCM10007140_34320 [Priestia taiwanensis]
MQLVKEKNQPVGETVNLAYWNEFYKRFYIEEESTFCSYIKSRIDKDTLIIDIGCGTGQDIRSFYREGFCVTGIDRSLEVINSNNNVIKQAGYRDSIDFKQVDISSESELSKFIQEKLEEARGRKKKLLVYSRFFLHSINQQTEEVLLKTLAKQLDNGDLFAAEFRTIEDANKEKVYNNHYRRFVDSEQLVKNLEEVYRFEVLEYTKGTGFSIYKGEDPYLARIIARKS